MVAPLGRDGPPFEAARLRRSASVARMPRSRCISRRLYRKLSCRTHGARLRPRAWLVARTVTDLRRLSDPGFHGRSCRRQRRRSARVSTPIARRTTRTRIQRTWRPRVPYRPPCKRAQESCSGNRLRARTAGRPWHRHCGAFRIRWLHRARNGGVGRERPAGHPSLCLRNRCRPGRESSRCRSTDDERHNRRHLHSNEPRDYREERQDRAEQFSKLPGIAHGGCTGCRSAHRKYRLRPIGRG